MSRTGNRSREEKIEKIKGIFVNNKGIKICSILLAIIVWVVIINIDDPYKSRTFSVDVEVINENALKSVNKVYEVIEGSTANVKVKGKKSVVDKLEASDILATADLSDLSSVNAVVIVPTLKKHVSSEVTLECNQVLKVSLENRASKQVKVDVVTNGAPLGGYTIGYCTAKPNMVEVSGGKSTVQRIESVKVFLNVNGATEDFSKRLMPVAYDANDNKVESNTLSFSEPTVLVTAEILEEKTIPVKVKVTGEPASGYQYAGTDCLPSEIKIAGTAKKLDKISEVTVAVDISGMTSSSHRVEQDLNISDYLPDGVTPLEEYQTVSIKIKIEQLTTKNIEINPSMLSFQNLGNNLVAEIIDYSNVLSIKIQGLSSALDKLTASSAAFGINCDGLSEGVYRLPVFISNLDESCSIIDAPKVKVKIYKRKVTKIENTSKPKDSEATKEPVVTETTSAPTEEPQDDDTAKDDENNDEN